MAKRSKRRVAEDDLYDVPDDDGVDETPPPKRRGSWMFRALLGLGLLAALVWFAPTIIVSTGLWKTALGYAAPNLAGKIDASSITLSWMSPIAINDLKVTGADGAALAEVKSIRSEKSLLDIVRSLQDPGRIIVTQPIVRLVVRDEGSNFEDLLEEFPQEESTGGTSTSIGVVLVVEQGTVEVVDDAAKTSWTIENLAAEVNWTTMADAAKTAKFSGVVRPGTAVPAATDRPQSVGELQGELEWFPAADGSLGSGRAGMLVTDFPTDIATPFLRRAAADFAIGGNVSCTMIAEWSAGGEQLKADLSKLASPQLAFRTSAMAAGEVVRLRLDESSAKVSRDGVNWSLEGLSLRSNLASLSGQGRIAIPTTAAVVTVPTSTDATSPTQPASASTLDWQMMARDAALAFEGSVDLAAIAQQLPATLHMKESARITSGTLAFNVNSRDLAGGKRFELSAKTNRLQGEAAGRQVSWEQPLEVSALVRPEFTIAAIEQVSVKSSFLEMQGEGDLRAGQLTARADLDKLASELSRLIDLAEVQLAGQMNVDVRWQQQPGSTWQLNGDGSLDRLKVILPGLLPWQEEQLKLTLTAEGVPNATGLAELTSMQFGVQSQGDAFVVQLTAPVTNPSASSSWPLAWKLDGDLATWTPRVQTFIPLGDWTIAGMVEGKGSGNFAPQQFELGETTVNISQLMAASSAMTIREPRVEVATAGIVNLASGSASFPSTTVRSSSIAARAENVNVTTASPGIAVTGLTEFRGDLQRLRSWFETPAAPFTSKLTGELIGRVELKYIGNVIDASLDTSMNNVVFSWTEQPTAEAIATARPGVPPEPTVASWDEKSIRLTAAGTYDPTGDAAQLASMNFVSSFATLQMSGEMQKLTSEMLVQLKGETVFFMEQVTLRLAPYLGPSFSISGQDRRPFAIRGPLRSLSIDGSAPAQGLVSTQLAAEAAVGWDAVRYMGLVGGNGLLSAKLDQGVLALGPLDMQLSEGKFTASPRIMLAQPQMRLVMDKGPLLSRVRISPDMCRDWLKFVAPVVADATQAEGTFSADLEGVSVPLDPAASKNDISAGGLLTIHTAQIGPGPLADQYLVMIRQLKGVLDGNPAAATTPEPRGWILLPEQQVKVEVVDGRVYHQGFTMNVKDVSIVTRGSVGLDQTLEMLAEVPIPDKWIEGKPLLVGLRGQRISIPIRGQINKPQLDSSAISQLAKQFVNQAAQGLLQDGLNKGLERLFGKPKPATPAP